MENRTILDLKIDTDNSKLFFGQTGIFRIDKISHNSIMNTFKKGFSDVWAWTAVDFSSDITGWDKLSERAQDIFLKTNGYQTIMDSGVVGIYNYLALAATNTEMRLAYQYVAQNESVHATSYSYGLSQMFGSEAEDKINLALTDPFIRSRIDNEKDFADELFESVIKNGEENYEILFKAIVATYVLESIKFPFSFYTTWNINRNFEGGVQGFSALLRLIAQDELDFHVPLNKNVLRIIRKDPSQGFQDVYDEHFIYEYVKEVVAKEKEWSDYLLKYGPIPGFTHDINEYIIEYFADKCLKDIGLEPIYKREKNDVITWFNDYRDIKKQNTAMQEKSNTAYNKGVLKNDLRSRLSELKEIYYR